MINRKRITALHEDAMELVERALMEREPARARQWFLSAFEKERNAAEMLADAREEEPTRSVLYRSAATMALDCRNYREADRLIQEGLSGNPPSEIADELEHLRERVRASKLETA
ncbi:MAG TPA: hypothetical protein VF789_24435 [Thermoanaerobaculia bacterium]